ncbi:unnamed protein product, partial [marine sediment metagenome]
LLVMPDATLEQAEAHMMEGLKCIRVVTGWLDNLGSQKFKAEITQLNHAYTFVKKALDLMPRP